MVPFHRMVGTAANKGSLRSIIPWCRACHAMKWYHFSFLFFVFFCFFVYKSYINSYFIITKQSIYLSPSSLPLKQKVPALHGVKKTSYFFIIFYLYIFVFSQTDWMVFFVFASPSFSRIYKPLLFNKLVCISLPLSIYMYVRIYVSYFILYSVLVCSTSIMVWFVFCEWNEKYNSIL